MRTFIFCAVPTFVNVDHLAACVLIAAAALAAACATVSPERAALDARAEAARTPAEHRAVAAEYEALAQRAMDAARRYASYAQQERATEDLIERARERPDLPRPPYFHAQWEVNADAELHDAAEMFELARRHREMAERAAPR